jgi:uncharacterized protein related to proFAR isomerase
MKLIPAISVNRGRVVVVENGQYKPLVNNDGLYRNPVKMVTESAFSSDEVFILDIDGIESNKPDMDMVKKLAKHKEIWLDSGANNTGNIMDLFVSGASRVVIGTKSIGSLEVLSEAIRLSENIIFSIDYDKGVVSRLKDQKYRNLDVLIDEARARGVQTAMIFDLRGCIDKIQPDLSIVSKVAKSFSESYVAGHITKEHLIGLKDTGLTGAIIDFRAMEGMDVI